MERAIRSVLGQTFPDFELLVVDDASTDDTATRVRSFDDDRIVYLAQPSNRGGAASRDVGIEHATGDYLAFLDSDDEWEAEFLHHVDTVFTADTDGRVGVVEAGRRDDAGDVLLFDDRDVYERLLALERHVCLSCVAVRREALGRDLRFDNPTGFAQDRHVFMEVARNYEFVSIQRPLVRIHREPGAHLLVPDVQLAKRIYFLETHEAELRSRPEALARHYGAVGNLHLAVGNRRAGRSYLRKAFATWPRHGRWLARWLGSFLGKPGDRFTRVVHRAHKTTSGREDAG